MNENTRNIAEAAMCLWEAFLELLNSPGVPLRVDNIGWGQARLNVLDLAEECLTDWEKARDAGTFSDSFDWDWCPVWLRKNIDRTGVHLTEAESADGQEETETAEGVETSEAETEQE